MRAPREKNRRPWSRRRRVTAIGVVLLVVALAAGVLIWWPTHPAPEATQLLTLTRSDQVTTVSVSGSLAPRQQANASFAVPGTVESIAVAVGDTVAEGDALASLDDQDLRDAVALAEANDAAARAQLQTVRDRDGSTSAQIAAARAQVEASSASLASARRRLGEANLASPLSGVVAQVNIAVGDQVTGTASSATGSSLSGFAAGAAVGAAVVVVVPDAWQLDATVGTIDLPSLKPGQSAMVTPTGTSTHVAAVVDTVGIVASGAAGAAATFPVTLSITDTSATLFSGASADAVITTDTVPGVLTVPVRAITTDGTRSLVTRSTGSGTEEVEVTTGRRFADQVEILSGVTEGDRIVVPAGVVVTQPTREPWYAEPHPGSSNTTATP